MSKLCCIFTYPSHYRESIYRLIDQTYDCDWYFGDLKVDIKKMDISLLNNARTYKTIGDSHRFFFKCGVLKLLFRKEYQTFFTCVESRSITDYLFVLIADLLGKKVYNWGHGWYGKETRLEAFLKNFQFRHINGMFVYSSYGRKLLMEQGVPGDKLFVIHNSLAYDKQLALRKGLKPTPVYSDHFGNNRSNLFFIGRLDPVKKLDWVLRAMDICKSNGYEYNMTFIGGGEEMDKLKKLTNDLGLQMNVWFYGPCYDEKELSNLIYNADLCVAPGNIGLTAMHTMVFGTPAITHNDFPHQMPEFEAIRNGITGTFFERDNLDDLASKIEEWMENQGKNREEIRQNCYREIDTGWNPQFQIDVIKNNLLMK